MATDLELPPGAAAPAAVVELARRALELFFGPPPDCGSHGFSLGAGVATGAGAWTFRVSYRVDPDHFAQYDKSTAYEGLAVLGESPSGELRVVSGVVAVQDNGTNYFHAPGERVSLLDLGRR